MKSIVCAIFVASAASTVSAASVAQTAPGSEPCTWGPSFWCSSKANANRCGVPLDDCMHYCSDPQIKKGEICSPTKPKPVMGGNPCTYGPSYWCASTANAAKCGIPVENCNTYCGNVNEYPDIQAGDICTPPQPVVATDPCTYGPSYWCASTANAAKCGVPVENCQTYCSNAKEYPAIQAGDICTRPQPVVGTDPCTFGPSYWCSSASNAKQCGVKTSECSKYCSSAKDYPDIHSGSLCKSLLL